ncbi:MAG: hypothetical protein Q4A55_00350 [Aerococcus sp.]|nr:hypothetical protein [Aerococcus sp.]
MAFIVLMLGVVSLLIALMTKGSIPFGAVSIGCFVTYFLLLNAGGWLIMGLFAFGVLLMIAELLLPTFGVLGVIGALSMYGSFYLSNGTWQEAFIDGTMGLIVGAVSAYVLTKLGYHLPLTKRLVLNTANHPERVSFPQEPKAPTTLTATTITPLHPVGQIRLETGQVVDARSETSYIPAGEVVEIINQQTQEWMVRPKSSNIVKEKGE